jgi:hypothetical protein
VFTQSRTVNLLLVTVLLAMLALPAAPAGAEGVTEEAGTLPPPGGLLQFQAGGHIAGFLPHKVYLASLDHALSVEFLGTARSAPPLASAGPDTGAPSSAPPLGQVTYPGLWPGIDLTYQAVAGGIAKSTYHLAPGADVARIQLRYNLPVTLQADGSLRFQLPSGRGALSESPPLAFSLSAPDRVGFQVGAYDPRYSLTIDPIYHWHTFYGSTSTDYGYALAVDGDGGLYLAGRSTATWDGPAGQDPLHAHSGAADLVVLKLDTDGAYQWHTFYGSTSTDYGYALAVDGGGVYLTGWSDATWNGPAGQGPLHAHSGGDDLLALKLDSSGAYQWHTFYGSGESDLGRALAVDGDGGLYLTGYSYATWDGPEPPLHDYTGGYDLVALKLDTDGAYQWHTFYGSANGDLGDALAADGGGLYLAGYSDASWNGPNGQDPLHAYSGSQDLVVLKLDTDGAYQWHTFYGSAGSDGGYALAVDGGGVYLAGYSIATWDGPTGQGPLHAHSGYWDLVALKLDSEKLCDLERASRPEPPPRPQRRWRHGGPQTGHRRGLRVAHLLRVRQL